MDWVGMENDYRAIRKKIENVIPGFEQFEERVANPGGFPFITVHDTGNGTPQAGKPSSSGHPSPSTTTQKAP